MNDKILRYMSNVINYKVVGGLQSV